MKNLVKNLIAMVLVVVSVASTSAKEAPVKIRVAGEKSIELFLGEISGKVWISFKDDNGDVIYSKRIKNLTSYRAKYDLATLPDGEYKFELYSADQTLNLPVTIAEGAVTLKEKVAAAPVVSKRGNTVSVDLSGNTEVAWDVIIRNEIGELVFTETVENEQNSKRKYDLSNLDKGAYTVQFNAAGNSFSHNVIVKN